MLNHKHQIFIFLETLQRNMFQISSWIISAPKAFGSQSAEPLPAFGLPRRWSLWAFPRHSGSDRKSRGTGVFETSKFRVFHSTFSVVRGDENISIHHTSFSTIRSIELNPAIHPAGEVCRGDLPWASPVPTAQCVGFGSCQARPSIECCTCTGTLAWCLTVGLENVEETEPITSWKHFSICLGLLLYCYHILFQHFLQRNTIISCIPLEIGFSFLRSIRT